MAHAITAKEDGPIVYSLVENKPEEYFTRRKNILLKWCDKNQIEQKLIDELLILIRHYKIRTKKTHIEIQFNPFYLKCYQEGVAVFYKNVYMKVYFDPLSMHVFSNIPHPHIRNGFFCKGDQTVYFDKALENHQLFLAVKIAEIALTNYNHKDVFDTTLYRISRRKRSHAFPFDYTHNQTILEYFEAKS